MLYNAFVISSTSIYYVLGTKRVELYSILIYLMMRSTTMAGDQCLTGGSENP